MIAQIGKVGSSGATAISTTYVVTVDVTDVVSVDVAVDVAVVAVMVCVVLAVDEPVDVTDDDAVADCVLVTVLVTVEVPVVVSLEVTVEVAVDETELVPVVVNVGTQSGGLLGSAGAISMKRVKSHGTQQLVLLRIPEGNGIPSASAAASKMHSISLAFSHSLSLRAHPLNCTLFNSGRLWFTIIGT